MEISPKLDDNKDGTKLEKKGRKKSNPSKQTRGERIKLKTEWGEGRPGSLGQRTRMLRWESW